MKKLTSLLIVFAGSTFFVAHAGDDEAKADLNRMQGVWRVESLTEEGKAVPAAELEILEVTIDKDAFTVTEKGKPVVKYKVRLDPGKKPKEIDFTYLAGDDKGKTEPGIYVFEKDRIRFCLDEKKKGRPTAFEGKEAATYSVMVLKKKEAK